MVSGGGVIRWIKQSTEKSGTGLEILSQAMFPCAVHIQAERHYAIITLHYY